MKCSTIGRKQRRDINGIVIEQLRIYLLECLYYHAIFITEEWLRPE